MNIDDLKAQALSQLEKVKGFLSNEDIRKYIIAGAAGIFAALYLTFVLVPKFGDMSKAAWIVSDLNATVNQLSTRIKRQDMMKGRLKELRDEYAGYSTKLPMEKEIPDFLDKVSEIAKNSKVKILSITPFELKAVEAAGKEVEYYKQMPILITAKSGYHQLGKFVSNLEKGGRFITISDLSIQHDAAFPRMHNVRMELKTYVSVEPKKSKTGKK
ncbi:MAG: type 4a pilus biogenesis protein PilO [Candidatus Omnitrophota bacterium]